MGRRLGVSRKSLGDQTKDREIVEWGGEVLSEQGDDLTLCLSKDSLNRTSLGWGFGGYYSGAISHELQDSRSCKLVLAGAKRLGTPSSVQMHRKREATTAKRSLAGRRDAPASAGFPRTRVCPAALAASKCCLQGTMAFPAARMAVQV